MPSLTRHPALMEVDGLRVKPAMTGRPQMGVAVMPGLTRHPAPIEVAVMPG